MSLPAVSSATAALGVRPQSSQVAPPPTLDSSASSARPDLRETFDQFVGQTFFMQMLKSMRKTVGKPAYFHGGQAEEVFQGQLDQLLAERVAEASADQFTEPMFQQFVLQGAAIAFGGPTPSGLSSGGAEDAGSFLPLDTGGAARSIPLSDSRPAAPIPLPDKKGPLPLQRSASAQSIGVQFDRQG